MQHTHRRIIFILLFCLAILPSIYIQSNYIGKLSSSGLNYHWLTASTMKFVDNWLEDGIVDDQMMMLEWPRSIENPTISTRKPYSSYLPGAPLEIFLLKKIFPQYETLIVIQIFNIINQFVIACLLMMLVWLGLAAFPMLRTWFALIAFVSYQLLPQTIFIHSMIFFADIAVLLPLLIVLFMELLLRADDHSKQNWPRFFIYLHQQKPTWLKLIQTIALTWAVLCDWLAIPLGFVLFGVRFLKPIDSRKSFLKDSLQLLVLPLSMVALFLFQLYVSDELSHLVERFNIRSSQGMRLFILLNYLIPKFFIEPFGYVTSALILIGSIFVLFQFIWTIQKKQANAFLIVLSIFMLTCYSHLLILQNHSIVHIHFSIIKFLLLALFLICYLPCLLMGQILKFNQSKRLLACVVTVVGFLFLWQVFLNSVSITSDSTFNYNLHLKYQTIAQWLRDNAKFEDVYLGKNLSIKDNPPMKIAWSRKPVYSFSSETELKQFINKLPRNTNFYAILSANELKKCHLKHVKIKSQIYDQYQYWSIIPLKINQNLAVRCLVE